MNRESCISHRPRQPMAVIRQDYYELMDKDATGAAILNLFEYWANAEIAKDPDIEAPWIGEKTIKEFESMLIGLSTDKQIRLRLAILKERGFIETRQRQPHRKTLEYRFFIDRVQSELNKVNGQTTADPTVKQPQTQRSNDRRPNGQMTADPTVKQPLHYIQELLDQKLEEEEAAATLAAEVEVEILEPEQSLVRVQDLNNDDSINEDNTLDDSFSAAADTKILKEIEQAVYDWQRRPWMQSATTFKSEVIKAVWQCNVEWYSLPSTKTPNLKRIVDRLRSLNSALLALNAGSITAWEELHNYWTTAKAISNPSVQQAFNQVAYANKQASLQSKVQMYAQATANALEDL